MAVRNTAAEDTPGRSIEQLRVLGKGGQASVSLCRDVHTGKLLALKTAHHEVHGEVAENQEVEGNRFDLLKEFDTIKFLVDSNVPGIVPVHRICRNGSTGQLSMLMDYCDGGTLLSALQGQPFHRLSERRAAIVLSSLSETLESCHKLGIMHRDVKLENVLINHGHDDDCNDDCSLNGKRRRTSKQMAMNHDREDEGYLDRCRFLLADFGLACHFRPGHQIRNKCLVGTSEYIAPEMIEGAYDERADVWSLGVLLHLMLTGHFPFGDPRPQQRQCSSAILAQTLTCPRKLNVNSSSPVYAHLSGEARTLLQGMLHKDPQQRITLSGVRSHPWLQSSSSSSSPLHGIPSFVGVKRIRFITHAGPDMVRELHSPSPTSSLSYDDIANDSVEATEPAAFVGPKRIRFITHGFPDIVRELRTLLPSIKENNDGRANQQQSVQGSSLAQPCNSEHASVIRVPRRPRQHRYRPRLVHQHYKQLNPLIPLQAAY